MSDEAIQTPMALQPRVSIGRRPGLAGLATVAVAIGIGALGWSFDGYSAEDPDSHLDASPETPVVEFSSKSTTLVDPPSDLVDPLEVPALFMGTWDLSEGCFDEFGTELRLTIASHAIQYYESSCDVRNLQVQGARLHGTARCEGEGEVWMKSIDFQVSEDGLVSSDADGSGIPRVRCEPPGFSPDIAASSATASSQPRSRGVVLVDWVPVSWEGPMAQEPFLARFSFRSRRHENTYDMDCRTRQFRWASNFDLRARRFTANAAGAEWRPLSDSSTKANAAFRAACQLSGPPSSAAELNNNPR